MHSSSFPPFLSSLAPATPVTPVAVGSLRAAIIKAIGVPVAGSLLGLSPVLAAQVEEIVVTDRQREPYVTERSSVNKFTGSLLDTPQSIISLSSQMLEDRGAMSLDDALRNVPGITLGAGEFSWQGNNPSIRGFSSRNDMFVDGMRDFGSYARDPFNLDSVEVLLGPSSMVFGRGSTGGVINQSSKLPVADSIRKLNINVGNAGTRRVTADLNEMLPWGEDSAARLNLLQHSSDVPERDGAEVERTGIAPSLSLGLGSATRLSLSHMYMKSDNRPDYGLPWVGNRPADVDRSNYYGFEDDYLNTEADISTVRLDHRLNETFSLNAQLRYADYARESRITEPQVATSITPDTPAEDITVSRLIFSGDSSERMLQGQINLSGEFVAGGITHALVTGIEMSSETSDPAFGFAGITPSFDYDVPVPDTNLANPGGVFTGQPRIRLRADTNSDSLAFYVLDTLKFSEQWQWIVGLRWDSFDTNYLEWRFNETGAQTSSAQFITKDIETSYRTALVWKPEENASVYLGWGTSFNPSAEGLSFINSGRNLSIGDVNLDPEENESLELGTKWQLLEERLHLDAALFRTEKSNARVPDPLNPGFNILAGRQRVTGLSMNAVGRITDAVRLSAGYTWLDSEQLASTNASLLPGTPLTNVAEHTASLWLNWAASEDMEFGAGMNYVDERLATNAASPKRVPSYWTFDAMARYRVNDTLTVKLNLTNIGNEYYIDQIHPWHIVPGPGFASVFAVNLDFQ